MILCINSENTGIFFTDDKTLGPMIHFVIGTVVIDYFLMTQESSFEFSRAQTILAENLCCNREIGVIPDQLTKKKLSAFPGHNVEKTSWTTFHS